MQALIQHSISSRRTTRSRLAAASASLLAALALSAGIARADDGALDGSWAPRDNHSVGIPGLVERTDDLGGTGIYAHDMTATSTVVQPDGKVLVAGFGWNTRGDGVDQNACVVRRYMPDGSVDPTFTGLAASINFSFGAGDTTKIDCYWKSITLQADGKILVAGQLVYDSALTPSGLLARFDANGNFDPAFAAGAGYTKQVLDFDSVIAGSGGEIYVAGTYNHTGFTDTDFYLGVFDASGTLAYYREAHFDLGGDMNDTPAAAVTERWSFGSSGNFHVLDEIYLVGIADDAGYADGLAHHHCAVAAFRREDGAQFAVDDTFNASGKLTVDFPVGSDETDTVCRTAIRRPGSLVDATGVVVGGERYYSSSVGVGNASYYALAEIDQSGNVTRHDDFAFFEDLIDAGSFNSIFGMAFDRGGKLVIAGYAGVATGSTAPADIGVKRYNADYSLDDTFGFSGVGNSILTLDNAGGGLPSGQREWANAMALDPERGRIVVVGERSGDYAANPNQYDWLLGALIDAPSDIIFQDGFD